MSVHLQEFSNEVLTDDAPAALRDGERVEFFGGMLLLNLGPEAEVTCPNVLTDEAGYLWPPVVLGYQFQCLSVTRVSHNLLVTMLQSNVMTKLQIIQDIDVVLETE
jgi:hypothetical protein